MNRGETMKRGKRVTLVRGETCYRIFDNESGGQIFGTYNLRLAEEKFARLEREP